MVGTLFVSVGMASDNLGDSSGDSQKAGNASQLNFSVVQPNNNLSPMRNGSNTQQWNNMSQFTFPQFSFFGQNPIPINPIQSAENDIQNEPQQNNQNMDTEKSNNVQNAQSGNTSQVRQPSQNQPNSSIRDDTNNVFSQMNIGTQDRQGQFMYVPDSTGFFYLHMNFNLCFFIRNQNGMQSFVPLYMQLMPPVPMPQNANNDDAN